MRLPVRKEQPEQENSFKQGIYELIGYGVLIQTHPVREHWVKECREGKVVPKRRCGNKPWRRDAAGNWFYLLQGEVPPMEDDLIPSKWIKGVDYGEE